MAKLFDFRAVLKQIPEILRYLPVTLQLAIISMILGLLLGLLIAVVKMKKIPVASQIANIYVSFIRGTPIIVQLYIAYFGIPMLFKYMNMEYGTSFEINSISGIVCAILVLSINESAYNAEIIRAALLSVGRGQIEAASALGMTYFQSLRRIILPEAIVVALPGIGNSFIGLIKGTSLAFTCAVVEMTAQGRIIGGRSYRYFEVYVSLALIYWLITIIIEQLIKFLEKKAQIPDKVETIKKVSPTVIIAGEVIDK